MKYAFLFIASFIIEIASTFYITSVADKNVVVIAGTSINGKYQEVECLFIANYRMQVSKILQQL